MENTVLNVYRGDVVENTHHGHIVVVNHKGDLLYSYGDHQRITHGRSALKPFQVLPLIESGAADYFQLSAADIALCASSHSGEKMHQSSVKTLLDRIGLRPEDLLCGVTAPIDKATHEEMIRNNEPITTLSNECSGVHVGMLATAVFNKEPIDSYIERTHPVQSRVMRAVTELTGTPVQEMMIAIDGCAIPPLVCR